MKRCVLALVYFLAIPWCLAGDPLGKKILDLSGTWLFRPGDDPKWARADLNDRQWATIPVPSPWENAGYPGYDGFAWYRKHFTLSQRGRPRALVLAIGRVDDADVVYFNGHYIGGSGGFGPEYQSMSWYWRTYRIPAEFINWKGANVIAVRVFDKNMAGGIVEGSIALHEEAEPLPLLIDLSGTWQIRKGDQSSWRYWNAKDLGWRAITVPGPWEHQQMARYDGYAWYRRLFYVPLALTGERLNLHLGFVDDLDETFINGTRVGSTGAIEAHRIDGDEYRRKRVYPIPINLLQPGKYNVIAVRVFDSQLTGGIYAGPVGIMRP